MKSRSLLLIAVAAGLLAAVLQNLYLHRREQALGTTTLLMRAKNDVPAGAAVQEADFEPVEFPEEHVTAFRDPKTKEGSLVIRRDNFRHVLNHPLRRGIGAGEFLLLSHFEPPLGPRLNNSIPDGKVAVTVPLDRATRSADLIAPGDQVDVYTVSAGGARGGDGDAAELLLKGVTVLAVGNQVLLGGQVFGARERSESSSVTLSVAPEQVPKLAAAAVGRASLILALRPPERTPPK